MEIKKMHIDKLVPAPYNPRLDLRPGDPEYEKLRRSIEEFGMVEPIVWNQRTGNVVGGHQRLKVLRELGIEEIEVSVVDLDEDREKALNIALNKIEGDWDNFKLKELLEELDHGGIDIELTGFDLEEIEQLITQFHVEEEIRDDNFDPDEAVEEIEEPISQPGDIWRLGAHYVLCGDSTKREDILRLMNGKKAHMVFTDPPYNVNYEGTNGKKIKNDNMGDREFYEFLLAAFRNAYEVTVEGGAIYIAHADSEGINFRTAMVDAGWLLKQCLIWVKNTIVMGRQDYHWKHEPILYGWKPGGSHKWYGGRKQSTVIEYPVGLTISKQGKDHLLTITSGTNSVVLKVPDFEIVYQGTDESSTIWRFEKPAKNADHPTMKPIPLVAKAIQNSSKPGEIVLDMFLGSGSTLIAAEQAGRICFGVEFDPVYCDVIVKRWEAFTGQKAVRLDG
ncbi:site-specific DNA-methyltransferase [Effusibacillus pohliae]|uniref:site-specific DNA-methyltransferase n=1 Tax=Effusibacillus pohliae TaxID=232270 RepID=UPI000371886D|nr:site-specific DNA-methyltransferase [Effusibacillus pohliae]